MQWMRKVNRSLSLLCGGVLFILFLATQGAQHVAHAGLFGSRELKEALKTAEDDITSLLEILKNGNLPFHHSRARNLLAFAAMPKDDPSDVKPAERDGATPAFWEFTLRMPLSRVASYLFSAEVPAEAVMPGLVRMGHWQDPESVARPLAALSGELPDPENAIFVRGVEQEQSTPDVNSGVYYTYDLKRLVAGYQAPEGKTIISISRLKDQSSVGMKGVAFGPEKDWYFFYSGIEGNLLKMVGWADSYMYDSITVSVFQELNPGETRVSLFKWVNAGWKGMNMVKTKHVMDGCKTLGTSLQEVLGSASMPQPGAIATRAAAIAAMPPEALRRELEPLAAFLEQQMAEDKTLGSDEFRVLIEGGKYLDILTPEEMASELVKDFVRETVRDVSFSQGPRP
jgi:hypothetical protein